MAEEAQRELADADFEPVFLCNGTTFGYSARQRAEIVVNSFHCIGAPGRRRASAVPQHAGDR